MTATASTTFDRKAIMDRAHFMARWREGNGKTYRERFAEALRYEWKQAKARTVRREWSKATVLDCALGLPIRSCPADAAIRKPAGIFAGVRPARRLFTTHSGRLAGSFAA
jgi:hypothetical protein